MIKEEKYTSKLEEEYYKLREKLDSLHYNEPFRNDSMPLIKRLLSDLIVTTESYRDIKERNNDLEMKYREALNSAQPMKIQMQSLIQENNHLHSQIIILSENSQEVERRCQRQLKRMESQLSDMTFLKNHLISYYENEKQELEKKALYRKDLMDGFKGKEAVFV
jgi:chromosome segregation ATPase